jgi:hypothetical protein
VTPTLSRFEDVEDILGAEAVLGDPGHEPLPVRDAPF